MLSSVALALILALTLPPASPAQEQRIEAVLGVAVEQMRRQTQACNLPELGDSDFLAVVAGYGASAVPTVSIAGQDEETSLADITIADGKNPIYLVLTAYDPVIWRITGETKRIRQIVVFSGSDAGIVGVPESRIHFNRNSKCELSYEIYRGRAVENDVPVLAIFGRRANAIGGDYLLYKATIDDTAVTVDRSRAGSDQDRIITGDPASPVVPKPLGHGPSELQLQYEQHVPAGVVEIDPKAVVATRPAQRYKVLPHAAGAYQLERSGALVPATAGDVRRWKDRAVIDGHVPADKINGLDFYSAYRVTRPIRLPGGLCGGYSMTFFVPTREYVRGEPCHSNIYVDDGTILANSGEWSGWR